MYGFVAAAVTAAADALNRIWNLFNIQQSIDFIISIQYLSFETSSFVCCIFFYTCARGVFICTEWKTPCGCSIIIF